MVGRVSSTFCSSVSSLFPNCVVSALRCSVLFKCPLYSAGEALQVFLSRERPEMLTNVPITKEVSKIRALDMGYSRAGGDWGGLVVLWCCSLWCHLGSPTLLPPALGEEALYWSPASVARSLQLGGGPPVLWPVCELQWLNLLKKMRWYQCQGNFNTDLWPFISPCLKVVIEFLLHCAQT